MSEYSRTKSIFEIYDVETGPRTVVREFPYLSEAPKWSLDGSYLLFNSQGKIYRLSLADGEMIKVDTG